MARVMARVIARARAGARVGILTRVMSSTGHVRIQPAKARQRAEGQVGAARAVRQAGWMDAGRRRTATRGAAVRPTVSDHILYAWFIRHGRR
eukprot:scaffold88250_cov48-Phaeocystis_antarctica.AAC.2